MKRVVLAVLLYQLSVYAGGEPPKKIHLKIIVTPDKRYDLALFKRVMLTEHTILIDGEMKKQKCDFLTAKKVVDKVLCLDFESSCGCACGLSGTGCDYLRNACELAKGMCNVRVLSQETALTYERIVLIRAKGLFEEKEGSDDFSCKKKSPLSGTVLPVSVVSAVAASHLSGSDETSTLCKRVPGVASIKRRPQLTVQIPPSEHPCEIKQLS